MNASQVRMVIPVAQLVGNNTTPEETKKAQELFDQYKEEFNKAAKNYEALPFSAGEEEAWNSFKNGSLKEFEDLGQKMIHLSGAGNKADFAERDRLWEHEYAKVRQELREGFDRIIKIEVDNSKQKSDAAIVEDHNKNVWTSVIVSLGMVISMLSGYLMATSTSKTIKEASKKLEEGTQQVSLASDQLSLASQQLAAGASDSAASLEEGVASIEELSSMVKMNAGNAQQAAALSQQGSDQAVASIEDLDHLVTTMSEIQTSSRKIEEIIGVIDDIAFQTNLLALNAAVEAARAGEQGKGFAVVADAVRSLAQKSATSAKDISDLIKQSVSQVQEGVTIAQKSNSSLKELGTAIKKISDLNQEVSAASNEQSNGVGQLSLAMNTLDKNVQANAASSEEVAASAEELSAQAVTMRENVHLMVEIVDGVGNHNEEKPKIKSPVSPVKPAKLTLVKPSGASKDVAKNTIPFDEDEVGPSSHRKVGSTDGF